MRKKSESWKITQPRRLLITAMFAGLAVTLLMMPSSRAAPYAACDASGNGYHSAWAGQSAYPELAPNQTATVTVSFMNTGCNTWDSRLRLGTWNPWPGQDQASIVGGGPQGQYSCIPVVITDWASCSRIVASNTSSYPTGFPYGSTAVFTFTVRAPSLGQQYQVYLRPLIEGVAWMEDQGTYMQITRAPHDTLARYAITARDISGITEISANILEFDPYYTAVNGTGSTYSWVMLVSADVNHWVQHGAIKWTRSQSGGPVYREIASELWLGDPAHNYWQQWPADPVGTYTLFDITTTTASNWDIYIDNQYIKTWIGAFTATAYQVAGETHDMSDQMPGGVTNHEVFDSVKYSIAQPAQYQWVTSSISTDPQFGASNPWLAHYEIWDAEFAK